MRGYRLLRYFLNPHLLGFGTRIRLFYRGKRKKLNRNIFHTVSTFQFLCRKKICIFATNTCTFSKIRLQILALLFRIIVRVVLRGSLLKYRTNDELECIILSICINLFISFTYSHVAVNGHRATRVIRLRRSKIETKVI